MIYKENIGRYVSTILEYNLSLLAFKTVLKIVFVVESKQNVLRTTEACVHTITYQEGMNQDDFFAMVFSLLFLVPYSLISPHSVTRFVSILLLL